MLLKKKAPSNKEKPVISKHSPKEELKEIEEDNACVKPVTHFKDEPLIITFKDMSSEFNKSNPIDVDKEKSVDASPQFAIKSNTKEQIRKRKAKNTSKNVFIDTVNIKKPKCSDDESPMSEIFNCVVAGKENIDKSAPSKDFQFPLGSVVWAKVDGYCWWPALVDNDPDVFMFYWYKEDTKIVTHYHVTFLDDDVSRVWVPVRSIRSFLDDPVARAAEVKACRKAHRKQLESALAAADDCLRLERPQRLSKYSFGVRFTGKSNLWARAAVCRGRGRARGGFKDLLKQAAAVEASSGLLRDRGGHSQSQEE